MQIDLKTIETFYINMDRDPDKNMSMVKLGQKINFNNYSRVQGVDIKGHPMAGCATSHYNIFKNMNGPTTILEDDCVIIGKKTVIDIPDDADALYLGLSIWGYLNSVSEQRNFSYVRHKEYKDIYKVDGMLATHAILYISKEYIEMSTRVAKWHAENDRHIDQGLALIQKYFNVYAMGNPLFYQNSNTRATKITLGGM